MRLSTPMIFNRNLDSLNNQQAKLFETGQKLASGRRVMRPSDDPLAASQAFRVSQKQGVTQQYTDTRSSVRSGLQQEEGVLKGIYDSVSRARTLTIQAGDQGLSNPDRIATAAELKGVRNALLGQANAQDGNGQYLFGGYQDSAPPFVKDPTSGDVSYVGNQQVRMERIDATRLMAVQDSGESILQQAKGVSGFMATADSGNGGSVSFKSPAVVDINDANFDQPFKIELHVDPTDSSNVTYDIVDENGAPFVDVNNDPILDNNGNSLIGRTYESGTPIEFRGHSVTLTGAPVDGDSFDIDQRINGNTDVFKTMDKLIAALEAPVNNDVDRANLRNSINNVLLELDGNLNNILTTRADVGARLQELDTIDEASQSRQASYTKLKSDLVDVDIADAISDFSLRQVALEAAQKTFMTMNGLSLFKQM